MGEDWRPVIPVIQILASIFAVQTLATPVQPLAMGLGATRALFNRSVLTLAIRVPITVFGLLAGGLMGLLWARCATGLIGMAINMHLVTRLIAVPVLQQVTGNARTLAATAAMAAATHGAGQALTPGDAGNVAGAPAAGRRDDRNGGADLSRRDVGPVVRRRTPRWPPNAT